MTLAHARSATDVAVAAVRADGSGIGAGYQPTPSMTWTPCWRVSPIWGASRRLLSSADVPPSQVIRIYTDSLIGPANTFSIGDTRKVTGQLTSQVTARADTLKSSATRTLPLISSAAGVLILLLLAGIRGARVPVR
jgi:hypothetical protein